MKTIADHIINPVNDKLVVAAIDGPGAGGANQRYTIYGFVDRNGDADGLEIKFQNGPIAVVGVNGVTHEALLAVVIDRLRDYQRGAYNCRENALALTALEEALMWLQKRTRDRMARGVEGTDKV